jgi:hypothetical protein
MFTVTSEPERTSYRSLMTILGRTGTWQWSDLGLQAVSPDLEECLSWTPAEMEAVAAGLEVLRTRLDGAYGTEAPATAADPPAQVGWVRAAAGALRPFPDLEERCGVTGAALGDLVDRDTVLRATGIYAGRIQDGAMDTRLFLGGFGWYVISLVLDGLREWVAGLPQSEAEDVLGSFAPMLVLVGRVMEQREAQQKDANTKEEKLAAEAQEAAADKDEAEAALHLRKGAALPREILRELALKDPPPPNRKGDRRTPR